MTGWSGVVRRKEHPKLTGSQYVSFLQLENRVQRTNQPPKGDGIGCCRIVRSPGPSSRRRCRRLDTVRAPLRCSVVFGRLRRMCREGESSAISVAVATCGRSNHLLGPQTNIHHKTANTCSPSASSQCPPRAGAITTGDLREGVSHPVPVVEPRHQGLIGYRHLPVLPRSQRSHERDVGGRQSGHVRHCWFGQRLERAPRLRGQQRRGLVCR